MMKTKTPEDMLLLQLSLCLQENDPEASLRLEEREKMIQGLVDFRKHQQGTSNWKRHRWNYLRGITHFHKSTAGKQFHRTLGRHLASRIARPKTLLGNLRQGNTHATMLSQRESIPLRGIQEKYQLLTAISSLRTHLYIERGYTLPRLEESVEVACLTEYAIPLLQSIEEKFYRDENDELDRLNEDEEELLLRLVDRTILLKECATAWGGDYTTLHTSFVHIFEEGKKEYGSGESYFMTRIMTTLREECL